MLRTRDRSRGGNGSGGGATAAPLPAASSLNAMYMGDTGTTRFALTNTALPAGDWSFGGWFKPTTAGTSGILFSSASASNYNANTSLHIYYDKTVGRISVSGRDASGNTLGMKTFPLPASNVTPVGLVSSHYCPPDQECHIAIIKTGSLAQLWLTFPGHAPVKTDECFTSMGAQTSSGRFGIGVDSTNQIKGQLRGWFKLSYALTAANLTSIVNGVDPTTLGTPAADDYYFLFDVNAATITSTINSITMSRVFNGASIVTGVGYAPMTEAVYVTPIGWQGTVLQHTSGSRVMTLTGRYLGASGGDIQVQAIDQNNTAFSGWATVATSISGGTWSGSYILPKGKRWVKLQMRKVISGIPSTDVMTSTMKWGIGEVVILCGQSLMEHMGRTANPHGSSNLTPNGFISEQLDNSPKVTVSGAGQISVTGCVNDGTGKIKLTFSGSHGQFTGQKIRVNGVTGTTEANGFWTVTVLSRTELTLDGSAFVNAYVSGGTAYIWNPAGKVYDKTYGDVTADGHTTIANYISNTCDAVVAFSNQAVGGQAIEQFYNFTQTGGVNCYSSTAQLASYGFIGGVGFYLWLHGHQNIGQTSYFSSGGSFGAWTGYGSLGTLYDLVKNNFDGTTSIKFGLAAFTSIGGITSSTAQATHQYRMGMYDWTVRKIAGGDNNVFFLGYFNDCQPQWENGTTQNAHLSPELKGYLSQAARLGHSTAKKIGGVANDATGPSITSASRSGAIIDLTVTQNGGSSIRVLRSGATISGFEVATDTAFTSKVTISDAQVTGANTIRITLASNPGATVYVRYQYGQVGDYATATYFTPRITGVADNGSGAIRVTCAVSLTPATPTASQKFNTGHNLTTGQWVGIEGVAGATQANGIWQVTVIDATNFDLVGSSSVGIGTFTANANLWQSSATGVVAVELGIPVYDDRTIGGVDTNGAPLQPTYTYVTAT